MNQLAACMKSAGDNVKDPLLCPLTTWTVDQLKDFLHHRHLPVTEVKLELVN